MTDTPLSLLDYCIKALCRAGADAGDGVLFDSTEMAVRQRLGRQETIERSEASDIGLRALIRDKKGYRQAIASCSDTGKEALDETVERVVSMARVAPPDPYCGLAAEDMLAVAIENLDLCDARTPSLQMLGAMVAQTEAAALDVVGITNSEGAEAAFGRHRAAFVTSQGFSHAYETTSYALSVSVVAGVGDAMQTDYAYSTALHADDLLASVAVGEEAGTRAVKKLHPRKVNTCQVPVLFEPRAGRELLKHFAAAINGAAVARGTSFLKDCMGTEVFAKNITVVDDPFRKRGVASHPFDGEGVKGRRRNIIENGTLATWLLDVRSANQLGLITTGHASRGISSVPHPSPTNFYLEGGSVSPVALMDGIEEGFYVTETFGMGINSVTGDYSQGASGFWIEKGSLAYPVSEVTIAGNLKDMYKRLTPANDLEFRYATNVPTLRVESMMVAGA